MLATQAHRREALRRTHTGKWHRPYKASRHLCSQASPGGRGAWPPPQYKRYLLGKPPPSHLYPCNQRHQHCRIYHYSIPKRDRPFPQRKQCLHASAPAQPREPGRARVSTNKKLRRRGQQGRPRALSQSVSPLPSPDPEHASCPGPRPVPPLSMQPNRVPSPSMPPALSPSHARACVLPAS